MYSTKENYIKINLSSFVEKACIMFNKTQIKVINILHTNKKSYQCLPERITSTVYGVKAQGIILTYWTFGITLFYFTR